MAGVLWIPATAGLPQVFGKAGPTTHCAVTDDLLNAGAEYHDIPAVIDGNVVTGRVPDDLPEFIDTVVEGIVERQAQPTI